MTCHLNWAGWLLTGLLALGLAGCSSGSPQPDAALARDAAHRGPDAQAGDARDAASAAADAPAEVPDAASAAEDGSTEAADAASAAEDASTEAGPGDAATDTSLTADVPIDVADAPPADTPPADSPDATADPAPPSVPTGYMRAVLVGQSQHAGTTVQFSGISTTAVTDAQGLFPLPAADGTYQALFRNGEYEEVIPELAVRAGLTFVKGRNGLEQAYPVVELPRAHRIHSGADGSFAYNTSPSGTRLLLMRVGTAGAMNQMWLLTGDARGAGTLLATGPLGGVSFLDDERVFFARAPNGWFAPWSYQIIATSGGPETVVLPAVVNHEYPFFVLEGSKIVFRAPTAGASTLTLVRADGTDAVALGPASQYPLLSPDGAWLAFVGGPWQSEELRLSNLRDGSTRVIASPVGSFARFTFTANSQRLVYKAPGLHSVALDGGQPVALGAAEDLVVSPEGSLVLLQTPGGPLQVVPVEGGSARTITVDVPGGSLSGHTFSSDGRYVFFETANALKAASTAALDVQILTTDYNGEVLGYSPVGHTAYFVGEPAAGSKRLYRQALDRSDARAGMREVMAAQVGDASISPRRRYFFFSNLDDTSLGLVDLTTGNLRAFRPGGGRPVFSADEGRLLFADGAGKVWVGNTAAGTQVAVGTGRFFYLDGFSPDGSRATFFADQILTAAASDGSVTTPIARWVNADTGLIRWMGNRQLVFSSGPFAESAPFIDGLYVAPVP